jgi:hypothetical protein
MIRQIDCRVGCGVDHNYGCVCDECLSDFESEMEENSILNQIDVVDRKIENCVDAINLLAEKIGQKIVIVPEVPAIPERLALEPIKKVKAVKKVAKKSKKAKK